MKEKSVKRGKQLKRKKVHVWTAVGDIVVERHNIIFQLQSFYIDGTKGEC